ncbi:hypothetical protein EWK04_25925 [Salmonella enterica subsp. enterica serovar Java]|uniref:Uncharacterized protein n=1 Tax=Salmonella enterica subsp. enterica serovar Java TaxID=224729 RepID=A0A3Y9C4U5_SALEB|nr:hypothetical protein [Salmonella enterica subsp. enterica serovar Java]ECG3202114.1 hypothetical protein [Salmonella enterica subsp. enterica serovar Java]
MRQHIWLFPLVELWPPARKEPVQYPQLTVELSCEGTYRPLQNAGEFWVWRGDSVSVAPFAVPLTHAVASTVAQHHWRIPKNLH